MTEPDWQKVTSEGDVKEGIPVAFKVGKEKVLLVRLEGQIHACAGECTHYHAPLEEGLLTGHIITCPWHNARFDVTTGEMVSPPALAHLRCYEVKVEDGTVYVRRTKRAKPTPRPETEDQTFVIVGAGAAGNAAAETLRREGFAGRICLITAEADRPYDRPNLSKEYLAGTAKPGWIPLRSETFYPKRDIELMTERRVVRLDCGVRSVTFENSQSVHYDRLLVATGGRPRRLDIPGSDLEGVFTLRSKTDADQIIAALTDAQNVVVIGASFIGLEAAASLIERGLTVSVVGPEEVPLARVFGERIGKWLMGLHEKKGVEFHLGVKPAEIKGKQRVESVTLSDGSRLAADVVIVGIGVTPVVDCLSSAGLAAESGVPVDEHLKTADDWVYAAGDIALVPYAPLARRIRVEHWAVAERQGQHAARAMMGSTEPYNEVPFFWTQQYDKSLSYAGLATSFDRIAYRGTVSGKGFLAGYYQEDKLLAVASLWRDAEFIAASEILKAGKAVTFEQFEDEKVDLRELIGS